MKADPLGERGDHRVEALRRARRHPFDDADSVGAEGRDELLDEVGVPAGADEHRGAVIRGVTRAYRVHDPLGHGPEDDRAEGREDEDGGEHAPRVERVAVEIEVAVEEQQGHEVGDDDVPGGIAAAKEPPAGVEVQDAVEEAEREAEEEDDARGAGDVVRLEIHRPGHLVAASIERAAEHLEEACGVGDVEPREQGEVVRGSDREHVADKEHEAESEERFPVHP